MSTYCSRTRRRLTALSETGNFDEAVAFVRRLTELAAVTRGAQGSVVVTHDADHRSAGRRRRPCRRHDRRRRPLRRGFPLRPDPQPAARRMRADRQHRRRRNHQPLRRSPRDAARGPNPGLSRDPRSPWTSATSPSSPTSTTARPRWWTSCSRSRGVFRANEAGGRARHGLPTTRSASAGSPSWPSAPPCCGTARPATPASTSSTPPATPTSAARSSGSWAWSTAASCWSTPRKASCPRPSSCSARR